MQGIGIAIEVSVDQETIITTLDLEEFEEKFKILLK